MFERAASRARRHILSQAKSSQPCWMGVVGAQVIDIRRPDTVVAFHALAFRELKVRFRTGVCRENKSLKCLKAYY